MTTLTVKLGERSYPIFIQPSLLTQSNQLADFIKTDKAVLVTNDVVDPLYSQIIIDSLPTIEIQKIVIADGEQHKNLASFEHVISQLLSMSAARDTTLIALGGGVIGDLTGFVAASFQRGMPFIQIPTTLLSQVDSSVGGKTAVNHPLGKNMIGAFYQPKAVFIDTTTLKTLPPKEFSAGMAEVIKYGIIYDQAFFSWLEQNSAQLIAQNVETLQYAIARCCEIKAEIVAIDEREAGLRALLNLGHTFGHAIEAEQGYGNWLHGEAVAAGMVLAAKAGQMKGWMTDVQVQRIVTLLQAFSLPIAPPADMNYATFMQHMVHDKKVQAGKLNYILPTAIGEAVVTSDLDETLLTALLN
ncbi:3-dehydroquinate synthase [Paraglaciecola polaris]|uniref:3-dehydroquinate synthase n=1 Tax=Paraglaciecola polaris LMG 21857 TaxID=1129793 RepID=K6ZD41_9ALTE|nr:3-dehydroquinate synthase [Paraglaciecola polaris]GAC34021.1 3-dehydroquinate synthase [Paraglaciecola polaris LMG 21857]|tara:strand:+ start:1194 stop:2261 length:1068 start_codon:yes stop_codon:yes gene_type:complete